MRIFATKTALKKRELHHLVHELLSSKLKVCFDHKIQLQFDWKLCLQLSKLGFNHEIQFPNYIFSYNLNEHYAFCLHLQSRNSFSVQFESLFSHGKE